VRRNRDNTVASALQSWADAVGTRFFRDPHSVDARELKEAEERLREALELRRKALGNDSLEAAQAALHLGGFLQTEGKFAESEALTREGVETRKHALPKGDWRTASAKSQLGQILTSERKFDQAEPLLVEAYAELTTGPQQKGQSSAAAI